MNKNKIIPSVWFHADNGHLSTVMEYYKEVFGSNFKEGKITRLGKTPSGHAELCDVQIFGQKYSLLCTEGKHHPLNDALSFVIQCEDQDEIDHYWNYFTKDGKASQCGWCIDKYGLRWQVLPKNMGKIMSQPKAWEIMMKQSKIIIQQYLQA